jgi:hypothetical protein
MPLEQRRYAGNLSVSDLPFLLAIATDVLQRGEMTRFQALPQSRPRGECHVFLTPTPGLDRQQRGNALLFVEPPPTLRLLVAVSHGLGGLRKTAFLATLEEAKQLNAGSKARVTMLFFQSRELVNALSNDLRIRNPHATIPPGEIAVNPIIPSL